MPHASKRHGDAPFIRSRYHLIIAQAAAGLDDTCSPSVDNSVKAIAKRKKCVTGYYAAGQRQLGVLRLDDRDPG